MRPTTVPYRQMIAAAAALGFVLAPLLAVGQGPGSLPPGSAMKVPLADGFDYPVGKPDGVGFHKARGFTPNGHLGDDWDGDGTTGNGDLGSPIYCTATGVVVLAGNVHLGWGNVVMVRHSYREPAEGNAVKTIDSLYGHLDTVLVREGQVLARGQLLGTMGTGGGLYDAHLHFEIRKNIHIGMFRSAFARDFSNYFDPTNFIDGHRHLRGGEQTLIALNTFTPTPGKELPPADAAYELGINRSSAKLAEMGSSKLNKSAIELQRKRLGSDKTNDSYRIDNQGQGRPEFSGSR